VAGATGTDNIEVYNNTIIIHPSTSYGGIGYGQTSGQILNNIIIGSGGGIGIDNAAGGIGVIVDNNITYNVGIEITGSYSVVGGVDDNSTANPNLNNSLNSVLSIIGYHHRHDFTKAKSIGQGD
jgi:hypothetical protein